MTGQVWEPTAPPLTRLTWADVAAYLRTQGLPTSVPDAEGPDLPDVPGAFVVGTFYGGLGHTTEGVFDRPTLQIRAVGFQNNPDSGHELAHRIDRALTRRRDATTDGPGPWLLGGLVVAEITRGPAPAAILVDSAWRTHYTCNYVIEIEANN